MKIWKTMGTLLIAALFVGCFSPSGNDTHTITFNSSGGSAVTSQQVAQGASVTEPAVPTRSGYAFRGWYSDSGLSNAWIFGSNTVDRDITLYAKWVSLHTVTFNTNGGSAVTSQQVAQGASATEPAVPTRSGYAFGGWYSDIGLSNAWTFGSNTVDRDITLYAKWVSLHTVTFNTNGGSAVTTQQVAQGASVTEPTAPTRSGHAFDGWYSDIGLSTAWTFGSNTVDRDITLYAKWVIVYHTITFNSNSGSAVTSQQVAQGASVTEPAAPTRSGHAFDGWYSDSGLSTAWTFGSDTVDRDITLYAKWVIVYHTITFNSNSGSTVTSQQVAEGTYATEPTTPTRSGHVFDGWYSDSGLSNAWTFGSDTVNSSITLYAKWVIVYHTITFNSNSGSAVTSQQVAQGASVTEPAVPTRSGYAFGGWYSDIGLSTAWTFGSNTVDRDITLYAKWVIVYHTITFNSNSGSAVTSQQVAQGASVTEPAAPTRSGHAFDGWYSDSGLSTAWTFGSDTVDRDITLYAKWVIVYHTITFNSNSGSTVTSQQVAEGTYATEPTAPTKSGHVFDGWYSDSGLSNAWTFGSDTVNSSITLYAKWVIVYHTITFNSNSGSAVTSQQVAQGASVTEPAAPTRSGHAFGGWYSDIGLSNAWTFGSDTVNSSITLYAKWSSTMPEMIFVRGGTFQMGSTDWEAYLNESPVHSVTLDSFYMAETEVTHRQYLEFLNDAGVSASGQLNGNELIDMDDIHVAISHDGTKFSFTASGKADSIDYPVMEVTWYGAVEYSNWLSEQYGLSKAYSINGTSVTVNQSANGYRLPTEAEWEYAARGGSQSQGYKYAGSNDMGEVGWYKDNSGSKTHPVKGKKANELGLYDMSGNVWEWCWDWYDTYYYSSSPTSNPTGPSKGSQRVLRGGSWDVSGEYLRSTYRDRYSPDVSSANFGFRPVRRP